MTTLTNWTFAKREADQDPDAYRREHGRCPAGYTFDEDSEKCVKGEGGAEDEGGEAPEKGEGGSPKSFFKRLKAKVKDKALAAVQKVAGGAGKKIINGLATIGGFGLNDFEKSRKSDVDKAMRGVKMLVGAGMLIGGGIGGVALAGSAASLASTLGFGAGASGTVAKTLLAIKGWKLGMALGGLGGALGTATGIGGPVIGLGNIESWAKKKRAGGSSKEGADEGGADEAFVDNVLDINDQEVALIKEFVEKGMSEEQIHNELNKRFLDNLDKKGKEAAFEGWTFARPH